MKKTAQLRFNHADHLHDCIYGFLLTREKIGVTS
jgi:hypothetical protein